MGSTTGWHEDAVIYSLDVKTFNDSDGDGWGDFQGLIDRLGYLDELGVDCLWVRPFFPSPLRDNGYDVADYYGVDSRLGSLGDVREFVERAHDRGIRVLTDMVFNHTSTDHEWFQRARRDPNSKYHDYYLWTEHPEEAYSHPNIFPDHEDGVWTYDEVAGKYYYHQFYGHQPDLNIANPAVREEIHDVLRFWLDIGVDGFRIDAAHPMMHPKGHNAISVAEGMGIFEEMKRVVREQKEDAILLAEADDQPDQLDEYFAGGEGFDMLFDFVTNQHLVYAVAVKDMWPLYRANELLPDVSGVGQWANFLRNHDEFNLLKLPHEAFEHAREFFGDDEGDSWIFGRGHRLRLADLYAGDHDRIAMAHSLMFSIRGSPVILAGDEIGMGSDLSLDERESVRTPMQWSDGTNAGFSTADPEACYNPVIDEGAFSYREINVADQLNDPDSLLERIKRLIDARTMCTEIGHGDYHIVDVEPKEVFVHRMDHRNTVLMAAHNSATEPRTVTASFEVPPAAATDIVGPGEYEMADGEITFELDACDYVWVRGDKRGERVPLGEP
ncbi:alpha-amylase family protein [Halapricum desulfuricans]|uniref:Glycosidase n=1 Tax=Halapricum desulfuricans TaxID=2841257 RepID=A0A897NVG9_9EURY|nr:alpha-amylase family protein [Halapricum desulfuricans]QSG16231.1 Glycosidase [Halapricum desulfuricans]